MNAILALLLPHLSDLLGRFIPDPQKKLEAQQELLRMAQAGELAQLQASVQVIVAEANGNWLQRSWRPLMMLFFIIIMVVIKRNNWLPQLNLLLPDLIKDSLHG